MGEGVRGKSGRGVRVGEGVRGKSGRGGEGYGRGG